MAKTRIRVMGPYPTSPAKSGKTVDAAAKSGKTAKDLRSGKKSVGPKSGKTGRRRGPRSRTEKRAIAPGEMRAAVDAALRITRERPTNRMMGRMGQHKFSALRAGDGPKTWVNEHAAHWRIRWVDCGKARCRVMHGPYRYLCWREGRKLREKYMGRVDDQAGDDE